MKHLEQSGEISERISQIKAQFFQNSNRIFANSIGIAETTMSSICSGKKQPGAGILNSIIEHTPDVSKAWLFFGEGDMLRGPVQNNTGNTNCQITNVDNSVTIQAHEIDDLRAQLKDAHSTIHSLTVMLSQRMEELEKAAKVVTDMLTDEE